jgi:Spy/CpxP family protein refolding chaperone
MLSGLSAEEIRDLQEGEGMGMARAAELNGYPGPSHILEAASAGKIHLYAEQRQAIERIHAAMKAKAQTLGHQILAEEAKLEASFRTGRIVEADLARQVEDIGRKRAEFRLTHLQAHLQTSALLRPQQIEEYYQFRGFAAPSPGHRGGH